MATDFVSRLIQVLSSHPPQRIAVHGAKDAAVLIPIVGEERPSLIFTVRTDTLPSHKGQISFPGGSIDSGDHSPVATALRETQEEIGLDPHAVKVLGEMDSLETFVSGFVVTPVIGWIDELPELDVNSEEVAEVLVVPLDEITESIRHEPNFKYGDQSFPTEGWVWNDHVIWGFTARILRLFLQRLADAGLADRPAETTSPWPDTRGSRV
jgi:8-oxo-dGTP pyrophosphatase MutT (NUDIX family)